MKILFIGGTGNISLSSSKLLLDEGHELWLLNRTGQHAELAQARYLKADIYNTSQTQAALSGHKWDVVVNWIAFTQNDVERDIALFEGNTKQYVFISSASCYKNPGPSLWITEETPLENPFWQYSQNKIEAERRLTKAYRNHGFPVTVVRPSHTYDKVLPLSIGGWHEYTAISRIKQGKPIVVHGDGTSLWTLTHAKDFAKGFVGLIGNPKALGEAFHITSDEVLSWNQIYQITAQAAGCEAKIVHITSDMICQLDPEYTGSLLGDKSESALFDNSKIKRLVPEFKATISYSDGIKKTLEWFDSDPKNQVIDPSTNAFIEQLIQFSSQGLSKQI